MSEDASTDCPSPSYRHRSTEGQQPAEAISESEDALIAPSHAVLNPKLCPYLHPRLPARNLGSASALSFVTSYAWDAALARWSFTLRFAAEVWIRDLAGCRPRAPLNEFAGADLDTKAFTFMEHCRAKTFGATLCACCINKEIQALFGLFSCNPVLADGYAQPTGTTDLTLHVACTSQRADYRERATSPLLLKSCPNLKYRERPNRVPVPQPTVSTRPVDPTPGTKGYQLRRELPRTADSSNDEQLKTSSLPVQAKLVVVDTLYLLICVLLDDLASAREAALAVESERTFWVVFALLEAPVSLSSGVTTRFLDRLLLADYRNTEDPVKKEDAAVDVLESALSSFVPPASNSTRKDSDPDALKILCGPGAPPRISYASSSSAPRNVAKGKEHAETLAPEVDDPDLDLKLTQILDVLPNTSPSYICSLLWHPPNTGDVERALGALFGGSVLPNEELERGGRGQGGVTGGGYGGGWIWGTLGLGRSDASTTLRDRTTLTALKAGILRCAAAISHSKDEEDQTYNVLGYDLDEEVNKVGGDKEPGKAQDVQAMIIKLRGGGYVGVESKERQDPPKTQALRQLAQGYSFGLLLKQQKQPQKSGQS
ncbi:hypothetical protein DXG01_003771 [Tephrocybe rancida]|nr:hypothetical protein DXG01_003771 [Tephrocybe rancida]